MKPPPWTKEETEMIIRLWVDDPENTQTSIATAMGRTVSSIAGRLKRLKECGLIPERKEKTVGRRPKSVVGDGMQTRKRKLRKPSASVMLLKEAVTEHCFIQPRSSVTELENWHCRWPLGEPGEPDFKFCCGPIVEGYPYCGKHCLTAYNRLPAALKQT